MSRCLRSLSTLLVYQTPPFVRHEKPAPYRNPGWCWVDGIWSVPNYFLYQTTSLEIHISSRFILDDDLDLLDQYTSQANQLPLTNAEVFPACFSLNSIFPGRFSTRVFKCTPSKAVQRSSSVYCVTGSTFCFNVPPNSTGCWVITAMDLQSFGSRIDRHI